jgi:hypothetical protein
MANIQGITQNITPGVVTNIQTVSTGIAVPGGVLIAAIIGEDAVNQIIIASAMGGGKDGLNPTYTSSSGADGRHFLLANPPVVSNRTQLFKNGVLLQGIEEQINTTPFTGLQAGAGYIYDYRLDITNGQIELATSHIVDQGGSLYTAAATNIGVGTINNLSLVDINAPQEIWTIKCVGVQRNNLNQPIINTAQFTAFGSVSGNVLNANGNPTIWISNGSVFSNGILSFSLIDTVPFNPGDYFTIQVYSGVLGQNDSLTATYIPVGNLNNPTFLTDLNAITTQFGPVSLANTLSLGCQLAFANDPPGIMALQAAPPLPRRTSYELFPGSFNALSTDCNDFVLPFPLNVQPDSNSAIHIFVTNPTTGVETQLLPNMFPFYTLGTIGQPTVCEFVFDNAPAPSGNSFAYSVVQEVQTINNAYDGYLNRFNLNQIDGYFSSATVGEFNSSYIGDNLVIIDSNYDAALYLNPLTGDPIAFPVTGCSGGVLQVTAVDNGTVLFPNFVNDDTGSVHFNLQDQYGNIIPGSSGTDGDLIAGSNALTSNTFTSVSQVNFGTLDPTLVADGYKLQVTASSSAQNVGLFDILSYNSGSNTLTIAKSFVSEHNLNFEIQDPNSTSFYLVLNHNIIPNGNSLRVTVVVEQDASFFDAGWETALSVLETQELDIIAPLPSQTISAIFQNTVTHCITMSNIVNRKERVAFIGAINGLTSANLTGQKLAAVESLGVLEGIQGNTVAEVLAGDTEDLANYSVPNAYGDTFRCVYFFPDQIIVQVGSQNETLDGFYIAAAAAGYVSGVPNVAIPLTNKVLTGFSIEQSEQFAPVIYQELATAGVTALTPVSGGGLVVWGLTTTQSGAVEEEEISIVFIRDRLAKSLRAGLAGFIGQPGYPNIIANMSNAALSLLKAFITQGLISNFTQLSISQDAVDPTQINASVFVQPIYPIDFIYVTVNVGQIAG